MYKLAFGPKAFIVVSDPVVVRHLLKVLFEFLCLWTLAVISHNLRLHSLPADTRM